MHTYTPVNSIFDGPTTILLSVLCVLLEVPSRARAKTEKSLNDFKFGTSVGGFSSDGAGKHGSEGVKFVRTAAVNLAERRDVYSRCCGLGNSRLKRTQAIALLSSLRAVNVISTA